MDNNNNIDRTPIDLKMLEYYDKLMKESLARVLNEEVVTTTNIVDDELPNFTTQYENGEYNDGSFHTSGIILIKSIVDKLNEIDGRLTNIENALS